MVERQTAERPGLGPVAVVGAGMAGLTCATVLAGAGIAVEIFEKSKGTGGRLATRPVGGTAVDIGAQYATARGPAFRAVVETRIERGDAAPWQPGMRDIRLDDRANSRHDPWFVGTPGMCSLVAQQIPPGPIHTGSRVTALDQTAEGWFLTLESQRRAGPFSAVAVTPPAPQSLALVGDQDPLFRAIADVGMSPCWTLACVFEGPVGIDIDVLRPSRGAISWAARNNAKPARDREPEAWVIHGDPVWSLDHLEDSPEAIGGTLLDAFAEAAGTSVLKTGAIKTHRWRYALTERPLGQPYLWDRNLNIGVCGDWCLGARVEEGYLSGAALAEHLSEQIES